VSNAVRYTERGGVLVGCRRRGANLQIAVWDSGCGIPEDHREDIFREFVQLDSPDRDRGKGLGLGLAIVARLAPLLGSRVQLRSVPGRGSMFAISVPLAEAQDERKAVSSFPSYYEPTQRAPLRGVFAVVVDDDEAARAALQGLLVGWGCLTLAARGGTDALAMLAQHDRAPELVICDYHLGNGENGIEAIRRIQAASERSMPAILVTGDANPEVLRVAREHQHPVLRKPVAPAKLRALLNQLLVEHESHPRRGDHGLSPSRNV
jgi:CheY-like chemotaxis protein